MDYELRNEVYRLKQDFSQAVRVLEQGGREFERLVRSFSEVKEALDRVGNGLNEIDRKIN